MEEAQNIIIGTGRRIRVVRKENRINLHQLALLTGISAPALSLIENGKRDPRLSTLSKIAGALRVPISDLTDEPPKTKPINLPSSVKGYDLSSVL